MRQVQPIQVLVSSVLDAPIEAVWRVVRDFNALPDWHPGIARSTIEAGLASDCVGCIRDFYLTDGENVREQLLSLSDAEHAFSYSIIESDVGLLDYVAHFSLYPITDGDMTYGVWSADFRTEPGLEQEKADRVRREVFQRGFDALKARLNRKR